MNRIKNLLNTKVYLNRRDLENSIIFGFGFGMGSVSFLAAIFFAFAWYVGSFVGRKLFDAFRK